MDRASFYTNASGSYGDRFGRLPGRSLEDLEPRGYPNAPPSAPHHQPDGLGGGSSSISVRHGNAGYASGQHSLPPILPRDADGRTYETYVRPLPRRAWDGLGRENYAEQSAAGLATPVGAPGRRLARTPSPTPPSSLLASGRQLAPLGPERGVYKAPPQRPQSYLDRNQPPQPPRALAFDDVHVAAPIKRPRVSLACLACRNRKSRCDGQRPTCKTCAHMKIECKWPEVDFRRAKTGDAARHRRKSAGPQERSPLGGPGGGGGGGGHVGTGRADEVGRDGRAARSIETVRPLARLPSPLTSRLIDLPSTGPPFAAYRDYDRPGCAAGRDPALSPYERYEHPHGTRSNRGEARPGSPSERYLVSQLQASQSEPHALHRLAINEHVERTSVPSLASASSDGLAAAGDPQHGTRSPPMSPPPPDAFWQNRQSYLGPGALPAHVEAARTRDIAAKLLALTRVDLDTHRHGLPKNESAPGPSISSPRVPLKHEAERLDDVYAVDWAYLGVPRSALTREFTDAMAGSTAVLQLLDEGGGETDPACRAVLHLFQTEVPPSRGGRDKVQRISIPLQLPAEVQERLLRKPAHHVLSLRELDLDLAGYVVPTPKAASDDSNLALLAGEAAMDGKRFGKGSSDKLSDVSEEMAQELFDGDSPKLSILAELMDVVSEHLNGIYLFFDRKATEKQIREKTASPVLLNAMCGLGCRFAPRRFVERFSVAHCVEAFCRKAHQLFWQAVTYPTCDAVNAGVMLTICEVGANRASSASSILAATSRMALELGLHRVPPPGSSLTEEEKQKDEFLFWSVYTLDRIASVMTGRPFTLQDRDIDARLPTLSGTSKATSFAYLIDLIRISNKRFAETLFSSKAACSPDELAQIRANLLAAIDRDTRQWLSSLPAWLRFSPGNLLRAVERGESSIFCGVHLSYHCTFLWRYLLDTSIPMSAHDLTRLRQSAYGIVEISNLCLEFDDTALIGLPMVSPAFFLAACVVVAELELLGELDRPASGSRGGSPAFASPSRDDHAAAAGAHLALQTCLTALKRRAPYWSDAAAADGLLRTYLASRSNRKLSSEAFSDLVEQLRYLVVLSDDVSDGLDDEIRAMEAGPVVREIKDARQLAPFFPALF